MGTLLEICDVSVSFGQVAALSDVTFSVRTGELLGLIGPNGAGKTTLFNAVSGFVTARGRAVLDGVDLMTEPNWRRGSRGLGRTFQTPRLLLSSNAIDNVSHGIPRLREPSIIAQMVRTPRVRAVQREARQEAHELLERIGFPYRRDVPLNVLPFGAERFVEIARALALKPKVLLLDEPAAGLHIEERDLLRRLLGTLVRDGLCSSVVLIEHDMSLVTEVCARIVVLEQGRVLTEGSPSEIQRDTRVISAYLGETPTAGHAVTV
jgi:branched-chain amino acid transport system ATP-binding protein